MQKCFVLQNFGFLSRSDLRDGLRDRIIPICLVCSPFLGDKATDCILFYIGNNFNGIHTLSDQAG